MPFLPNVHFTRSFTILHDCADAKFTHVTITTNECMHSSSIRLRLIIVAIVIRAIYTMLAVYYATHTHTHTGTTQNRKTLQMHLV